MIAANLAGCGAETGGLARRGFTGDRPRRPATLSGTITQGQIQPPEFILASRGFAGRAPDQSLCFGRAMKLQRGSAAWIGSGPFFVCSLYEPRHCLETLPAYLSLPSVLGKLETEGSHLKFDTPTPHLQRAAMCSLSKFPAALRKCLEPGTNEPQLTASMCLPAFNSRYRTDGSLEVDLRVEGRPMVRFGPYSSGMP